MKFLRPLIFILVSSLFLTACVPDERELVSGENVSIAYAESISSYSPVDFEAKNRKYLSNIYEALVRYDRSFNYDTGLSVSWGRSDELTWEFKLREGVFFHDGTNFDADDVVYSLEMARTGEHSQLVSLLSTIENVERVEEFKVRITTFDPDPLLLNKLTSVYMVPVGYSNFLTPTGTGPYLLSGLEEGTLMLTRFQDYWGDAPYYETVDLVFIPSVDARLNSFLNHEIDVLANVPPQFVPTIEESGAKLEVFPSLEVSYLMVNFKGALLNPNVREALWLGIGSDYAEIFGEGFLLPTNQHAPRGIFGYLPDVQERSQDIELALKARNKYEGEITLEIDVPVGLEALGEQVAIDLNAINITAVLNVLPYQDFEERILSGESDIYFFGWKYDLADVADFYETVLHSNDGQYGEFNGINYSNFEVDEGIELAATVLDVALRREILGDVTGLALDERVMIPLFEAQVIYGLSPNVHWSVRLDGQILASEIIGNVVQY